MTWLAHAVDYQLFSLNPWGHHLSSVLLHALNAGLLFLLLAWMSKRTGPSLLVAALFALHPLNVESVAWIAERKSVLSTTFFLLAIGAYVWYARKPDWRRYLLLVAMFALGLMTKPMVITLPFVLLLLDYWPLERFAIGHSPFTFRQKQPSGLADEMPLAKSAGSSSGKKRFLWLLLEKLPLLMLSAASGGITLIAQHGAVRSFQELPFAIRAENAVVSYVLYLWKMVWPARLAALYPHPANGLRLWEVLSSSAVLAAITALVLLFRQKRYLAVGWFWFLGTLVPVIGFVQVGEAAMADRYAYISLIGIFIMIAWALDDCAGDKNISTAWRLIPALSVLALLAAMTFRQIEIWHSEYSVWAHAVAVTEWNPHAHDMLGAALLNPDVAMSSSDLDKLDVGAKRLDEARKHYEEAARSYHQLAQQNPEEFLPDLAGAMADLGNVAGQEDQPNAARQYYEEALQDYRQLEQEHPGDYQPFLAAVLSALGAIDQSQNRVDEARARYSEALHIYGQLGRKNPGKYQPQMQDILMNLSSLKGS